jgi:hypothetical protein
MNIKSSILLFYTVILTSSITPSQAQDSSENFTSHRQGYQSCKHLAGCYTASTECQEAHGKDMSKFTSCLTKKFKDLKPVKEEEPVKAKQSVNAIDEAKARCKKSMSQYGAAMVKACVDQDMEVINDLNGFASTHPKIYSRCLRDMRSYGFAMVKACITQDVDAQKALDNY